MGIVRQRFIYPGLKVCKGDSSQYCLCIADAKDWLHLAVVLAPGAVLVVFDSLYYAGLDWVDCRLPPPCKA